MARRDLMTRLPLLGLLLVAGAVGIYFAASAGGAGAALLAAAALACAAALAVLADRSADDRWTLARVLDGAVIALPGGLILFFSLNSGGYFPDAPAIAAIVLVIVLVLRITLVEQPFAAFSGRLTVVVAALGLFTIWTLLSSLWSHSPGRAAVEFDRAFMFLLVVVVSGSVVRTSQRLRALAAVIAGAAVIVAVIALATRLAPDHFPVTLPALSESNLAYPLTYSNALGILCVLGVIPCLYFATSVNQPLVARALGSAAVPILVTTVYLTLSRGPVAAGIIGIGAFLLLGRPRGLVTGLAATIPPSVIAIASAYQHPVLTENAPKTSAAAATQGHRVAVVLFLCAAAAAAGRVLLARIGDRRLRDFRLPERSRKPAVAGAWAALVLCVVIAAAAVNAPSKISTQYHRFISTGEASPNQDLRQSIFSHANRGIVANWKVAVDAFKSSPLHGVGAGDYENYWYQHRPANQSFYDVVNAHSLYVQVLGELGIVGFVLLLVVLGGMLVGLAPLRRGANRPLYAALFALLLTWLVHAGIDWDWEMPAVTVGALAVGAAGLATHRRDTQRAYVSSEARVGFGLALILTAILPALIFTSQQQLNTASDALAASKCRLSVAKAADSIGTLDLRPDPYTVLALCQQDRGRTGLAIQAMRKAVSLDPHNWRYHYQLAILLGGAGLAPRGELLAARSLNPTNADVKALLARTPPGVAINWDVSVIGPTNAQLVPR